MSSAVQIEEDEEDFPDLRKRLAEYHLDSSPDNSAGMYSFALKGVWKVVTFPC